MPSTARLISRRDPAVRGPRVAIGDRALDDLAGEIAGVQDRMPCTGSLVTGCDGSGVDQRADGGRHPMFFDVKCRVGDGPGAVASLPQSGLVSGAALA